MKLARPPSRSELEKVYSRLQWDEIGEPSAEELVLWAQWGRLDARLAEILIRYLLRSFRKVPALPLWEKNRDSPLPASLAVLVDFARSEASGVLPAEERAAFQAWAKAVLWKTPKAPFQFYFVREGKPRPERDLREIGVTLRNFSRWGFFGSTAPVSEKTRGSTTATMLAPSQRCEILRTLARSRKSFTVADFILACGGRLHRRAAERDLRAFPGIVRSGSTRAARYRGRG
jgi:hypothetical protein